MLLHKKKDANPYVSALANYARERLHSVPRGVLLLQFEDRANALVAGLFGNENYLGQVEKVRQCLQEAEVEELGFGLSEDGYTWALLVRPEEQPYQTALGKAFQMELFKETLNDVVQHTWKSC